MKYEGRKRRVAGLLLLLIMVLVEPITVRAAVPTMNVSVPGEAVKDGKYIYYAYEMSGVRTGIMRYDTKAGKKKEIVSYRLNGSGSNGFYDLQISGSYIFATWDQAYGTSVEENYIYRFSKDGKKKKKLAIGSSPIVIGRYIYYIQEKKMSDGNETYSSQTGYIYRMKKDGSGKKKVAKMKKGSDRLYLYRNTVLYSDDQINFYDLKGKVYNANKINITNSIYCNAWSIQKPGKVIKGNEIYYLEKNTAGRYTKLCKRNRKTGKAITIAVFSEGIKSVRFCGDYLMVKGLVKKDGNYTWDRTEYQVYCISMNGKTKKKLLSWDPAE